LLLLLKHCILRECLTIVILLLERLLLLLLLFLKLLQSCCRLVSLHLLESLNFLIQIQLIRPWKSNRKVSDDLNFEFWFMRQCYHLLAIQTSPWTMCHYLSDEHFFLSHQLPLETHWQPSYHTRSNLPSLSYILNVILQLKHDHTLTLIEYIIDFVHPIVV